MSGIHHLILGASSASVEAPPSVPVTPTPTGRYFTFTASAPFVVNGVLPINASLVVIGGGNAGTGGSSSFTAGNPPGSKIGPYTPVFSQSQGSGGKSGVVNYQPSTSLSPGTYSVVVGAASSTSGIYQPPSTAIFEAGGGPVNPLGSSGTGGAGSSAAGSGTSGGTGTTTPWGTYAGGGGGGPGGTGGPGGGGPAGNPGVAGSANTGSGGGGGNAPGPPGGSSSGGAGAAGIVIIQVPLAVG